MNPCEPSQTPSLQKHTLHQELCGGIRLPLPGWQPLPLWVPFPPTPEGIGLTRLFTIPWFTLAYFGTRFYFTSNPLRNQVWLTGAKNGEDKCGHGCLPRGESPHSSLPLLGGGGGGGAGTGGRAFPGPSGHFPDSAVPRQRLCGRLQARAGKPAGADHPKPGREPQKVTSPLCQPHGRPCSSAFLWRWL